MNRNRNHLSRVLIATPEVTYLPDRMGSISKCLSAKAGGLADVSASLVCELYRQGADVHIAIPNYRTIFGDCLSETLKEEQRTMCRILPDDRLHLAKDHSIAHRETVYTGNGFEKRVAVHDYDPALEHLGYGAADFVMMPSLFEPCGLPQMIGANYGALPIAHAVGGLRDTVRHLNAEQRTGNGFLFETYDSGGLFWAIQQAMAFYHLPAPAKSRHISRIMAEAAGTFSHRVTARRYIDLYQELLRGFVIDRMTEEEIVTQKDNRTSGIDQERSI
jgi:glycogen synthase